MDKNASSRFLILFSLVMVGLVIFLICEVIEFFESPGAVAGIVEFFEGLGLCLGFVSLFVAAIFLPTLISRKKTS